MTCTHSTAKGGCDHCWKLDAKEAFDRCSRCGETLIADGTEEADFATMCPDCDEEYRAELDGDLSEPL